MRNSGTYIDYEGATVISNNGSVMLMTGFDYEPDDYQNPALLGDNIVLSSLEEGGSGDLLSNINDIISSKELQPLITEFIDKHLPSLYYQRIKGSIFCKVSFTKQHAYKKLPFYDVSTKNGHIEGVATKISNYVEPVTNVINLATLPVKFKELREHQKNGKDTIREYIDLSIGILEGFVFVLEGVINGSKKVLNSNSALIKNCSQALKSCITEKGLLCTTSKALSRFLGVVGLGFLAFDTGACIGNLLRKIPIAEHNLGYFIDNEIDELFNHPYKWASKSGFLGGTIVIALLMDAYKHGIDICTTLRFEMNKKPLTSHEKYKLEAYKLRNKEMYIQAPSPKYIIKSR